MSMWVAGIGAAVAIGGTVYGADQQRKANHQALDANKSEVEKSNDLQWAQYLLSRGINPAGAAAGQMPTGGGTVNTKLPLWAQVSRAAPNASGVRRFLGLTPRAPANGAPTAAPTGNFARGWGDLGFAQS